MSRTILFALPVIAVFAFVKCTHHDNNNGNNYGPNGGPNGFSGATLNSKITISMQNVNGFTLVPHSSTQQASPLLGLVNMLKGTQSITTTNTLYSINKDNSLSVVTVTNSPCESGSTSSGSTSTATTTNSCGPSSNTSTVYPAAMFPTPLYLFMAYVGVACGSSSSATNQGPIGTLVALEKATGNLYCIPGTDGFVTSISNGTQFLGGASALNTYFKNIQTDSTGKIIWINNVHGGAFKAVFTDPNNPTVTTVAPNSSVNALSGGFAVNAEGDAFLGFGMNGNNGGGGTPATVELGAGTGYDNVSIYQTLCVHTSTSQDNPDDFYYAGNLNGNATTYLIYASQAANFTPTQTTLGISPNGPGVSCAQGLVQIGNHTFMSGLSNFGGASSSADALVDVTEGMTAPNPTVTIRHFGVNASVNPTTLSQISQIRGAGDYLYILGTDNSGNALIVSYGPVSGAPTLQTILSPILTAPNNYTVAAQNFDVSGNGDITLQGTQSSNGATILVTIPAGTVFQTSDVSNSTLPTVAQIVRIN